MKKQDIRNAYTRKVTELLNQGYTIFPDTMSGHQGEIAHIDLSNGSEILRVLLGHHRIFSLTEGGFYGNAISLIVGKAAPDTRVFDHWDGTVWNNRLEPRFEIEWAEISNRGEGWYTDLDEADRIGRIQRERCQRKDVTHREKLGDAYKSAILHWIQKQPKMKTAKLEDIEKMERFTDWNGKRRYEITARGKRYAIR